MKSSATQKQHSHWLRRRISKVTKHFSSPRNCALFHFGWKRNLMTRLKCQAIFGWRNLRQVWTVRERRGHIWSRSWRRSNTQESVKMVLFSATVRWDLFLYIRIFKSKPSKLNWSVLILCLALHYPQINCPQEFSGISHFHYLILYNFLSRFSSSKRSTLENLLQQLTAVL